MIDDVLEWILDIDIDLSFSFFLLSSGCGVASVLVNVETIGGALKIIFLIECTYVCMLPLFR